MLTIIGTVPLKGVPLTSGPCQFRNGKLQAGNLELPLINGTSVMIAAAIAASNSLGIENPHAILAGDIGAGDGSNLIYRFLRDHPSSVHASSELEVFALHYIKPNILYAKEAIKSLKKNSNAILIGDAGAMYVAKAAGIAKEFDLFTPDPGEMAFLADPDAVHPAYVRNYLFESITDMPSLIKQTYENSNASKFLLVKGATDYIVNNGKIIEEVATPNVAALEAIGGTGDTLAGIVSSLIASGLDVGHAAVIAAKTNRLMGDFSNPNPSTKVWEMLPNIPRALQKAKKTQEEYNHAG